MKNILSFVGVVIAGLIIYFLGAKFGSHPESGGGAVKEESGDPAVEVYQQFTEYRAKYDFSLAKKMSTDNAQKKVFNEKVGHKTLPEMEVLFISSEFKSIKNRSSKDPARKEYEIVEERLINTNPNAPGAKTRKKITHEHTAVMIRQEGKWLVSDYKDEAIPE